ncbi:hypothetical protein ACWIWK_08665 [Helicobacter sp. 23-1048]
MKKFIALGFLMLCFVACGDKSAEQSAFDYANDMLAGNVTQIAKNAKTQDGQALNETQKELFIQDRQYASKEYRVLSKQNNGIKEISVYDNECAEKLPQDNAICVVYLTLIFNDETGIPMAVPLVQIDKKWYPVFDVAYPQ